VFELTRTKMKIIIIALALVAMVACAEEQQDFVSFRILRILFLS